MSDVREDIGAGQGRAEGPEDQTGGLLPEEPVRAGRAGAEALQSARTNAKSHHRDVESRLVKILVQWLKPEEFERFEDIVSAGGGDILK